MKYFIDFEANAPTNEIIEIGCIDQNNRSFKTYIKSSTPLDNFVKKLTHIKDNDLENAPEVDEAFKSFYNWLKEDKKFSWNKSEFYCYGNSDKNFLKASAERSKEESTYFIISALVLNLNDFTKRTNCYFQDSVSLSAALNYFKPEGEEWEQRHDALDDATALKELYNLIPAKKNLTESPFRKSEDINTFIIRRNKKGQGYVDYETLEDAIKAVVAMAKETSTEIVKPENIRKRIISAINTKKSYFGYKWKMIKKGEDINV